MNKHGCKFIPAYDLHPFFVIAEVFYMDYSSISDTAKRWGLSRRRIQTLCSEGRIPGAARIGMMWAIPSDAEKPEDARIKSGHYIGVSALRKKNSACTSSVSDKER